MADEFEYECAAPHGVDFAFAPVNATLEPGERITLSQPCIHPELTPISAAARKAAKDAEAAQSTKPAAKQKRKTRKGRKPKSTTRKAPATAKIAMPPAPPSTPAEEPAATPAAKE